MKKILLVCNAGMSTSLLVTRMQKVADEKGMDVKIEAHASTNVDKQKGKWDVCLIGPQIKYAFDTISKALEIPTAVIDMRVYGLADGEKALAQALELIE